MYIKCQSSQDT